MITTKATSKTLIVFLNISILDASYAADIKAELKTLDVEECERVIIDMENVTFIDSSGIGALLSFYKQIGSPLTLRYPTPAVLSVLELLRLHRVFEIEYK